MISVQPSFCTSDYWMKDRLGETSEILPYPFKSILKVAKMIGGSDAPVEEMDPLVGIYSAVNNPVMDERISLKEAIKIYAEDPLSVGKKCNATLLNVSDPGEIFKAKVEAVIQDGRLIFLQNH